MRELRNDPTTAGVPVIFHTATYLIEKVRQLVAACGVSHVIVKPCEPEEMIRVVAEVLSSPHEPVAALPSDEFHHEHLRLLNAKLQKVEELRDAVILAGAIQN